MNKKRKPILVLRHFYSCKHEINHQLYKHQIAMDGQKSIMKKMKSNSLSNFDPFSLLLVSPFSCRLSSFYLEGEMDREMIISEKKGLFCERVRWKIFKSYRLSTYWMSYKFQERKRWNQNVQIEMECEMFYNVVKQGMEKLFLWLIKSSLLKFLKFYNLNSKLIFLAPLEGNL